MAEQIARDEAAEQLPTDENENQIEERPQTDADSASVSEAQESAEAALSDETASTEALSTDDGRNWYVIHCYSGYENKVRHNLEQRIESMGMKGKIFDVIVP